MHRSSYAVAVAVAFCLGWPAVAVAQSFANISINGNDNDWTGQYIYSDVDEPTISNGRDIDYVQIANNATYFFVAIDLFANASGIDEIWIFVDRDNDDSGDFDNDDRRIRVQLNTGSQNCSRITITSASSLTTLSNVGCATNFSRNGDFIELRVPLASLGISSAPEVGVLAYIYPTNGSGDISPGAPYPTFIEYDNTGTVTPTHVSLSSVRVRAERQGGVTVRFETSAEWHSAGTWVLRQLDDDTWQPLSGQPLGTYGLPTGGTYEISDPAGRTGDYYMLVEVDTRKVATVFGPFRADAGSSTRGENTMRAQVTPRDEAPAVLRRTARPRPRPRGIAAATTTTWLLDVAEEGAHVVCASDIRALGFRPFETPRITRASEPVPLYAVSDAEAPCAGYLFFASAPTSPYAATDVYVMRASVDAVPAPPTAVARARFVSVAERDLLIPMRRYIDMGSGEANRFFGAFASPHVATAVPAELPNLQPGPARLRIALRPLRTSPTPLEAQLLDAAGVVRATAMVPSHADAWTEALFELPSVPPGNLRLRLGAHLDPFAAVLMGDVAWRYPSSLVAEAPTTRVAVGPGETRLTFSGDTWVWQVSGAQATLVPTHALRGTTVATLPWSPELERSVMATPRNATTRSVPRAAPATAHLSSSALAAEYLVLGPADTLDAVAPLLEHHRAAGMSAEALDIESVYGRFSQWQPTPAAVADLLEHAQATWAVPPRFLLLLGETSYDPHGNQAGARQADAPLATAFLPEFRYRAWSDASLVRDAAGLPRVAVGRLPSSDPQAIAAYVNKAVHYTMGTGPSLALASGQGASDPDFAVLASFVAERAALPMVGLITTADTSPQLLEQWGHNPPFVVYAGHGDSGAWSGGWLTSGDAGTLGANAPPVVLSMACMDGMHAAPTQPLAWALASSPESTGAALTLAPTSLTDPNLAAAFLARVVELARGRTWGEGVLDAWREMPGGAGDTFVLLGDPALPGLP